MLADELNTVSIFSSIMSIVYAYSIPSFLLVFMNFTYPASTFVCFVLLFCVATLCAYILLYMY